MSVKRKKLTKKIERLFKNIEKKYDLPNCYYGLDIRASGVLDSHEVDEFQTNNNVFVRMGIGCIAIDDLVNEYIYLVSWFHKKRIIECKDSRKM